MSNFDKQLKMKNQNGAIDAYLSSQPELTSSTNNGSIPLSVTIASKQLNVGSATSVELFDETASKTEKTATMTVSQTNPANKPMAGHYIGVVSMMFESVVTP